MILKTFFLQKIMNAVDGCTMEVVQNSKGGRDYVQLAAAIIGTEKLLLQVPVN